MVATCFLDHAVEYLNIWTSGNLGHISLSSEIYGRENEKLQLMILMIMLMKSILKWRISHDFSLNDESMISNFFMCSQLSFPWPSG